MQSTSDRETERARDRDRERKKKKKKNLEPSQTKPDQAAQDQSPLSCWTQLPAPAHTGFPGHKMVLVVLELVAVRLLVLELVPEPGASTTR